MSINESKFKLFLHEFTKKYPQKSDNGELNYIFVGSFALNCYHFADDNIEIMTKENDGEFTTQGTVRISDYNKKLLEERLRAGGDIDIVVLSEEYKEMLKKFQLNFDISNYKDIFIESQANYGKEDYKESIKIDGVQLPKSDIAKVNIGDNDIFLESPKVLLAHKLIYTMRQLQQRIGGVEKTKNSFKDIYVLLKLSTQLFTRDDIKDAIIKEIENMIRLHEREGIQLDYFTQNISTLKQVMHEYCGDRLQEAEELFDEGISDYRKKIEIQYCTNFEEK